MDHAENISRVVAALEALNQEALRTTLNLEPSRFRDVAARLIERFGDNVAGNEIYLGLYALERDPALKHLFAPVAHKAASEQADSGMICGMPAADFLALRPESRLALYERDRLAKQEAARAAQQGEADSLAHAARPPGFDEWSPERKLSWANEAQALAAKAREKAGQ